MKRYTCVKKVNAKPLTAGEYKHFYNKMEGEGVGWPDMDSFDDDAEGYFVIYDNDFMSWSPRDTFESGYQEA